MSLKLVSNHFPLILDGRGRRRGPSSFRFENMWPKVVGFKDILKSWWKGYNFSGSSSFILAAKLKGLKSNLEDWNKEVFHMTEVGKAMALNQVDYWDTKKNTGTLSLEEMETRKEANEEGDTNTNFFHKMANAHRRRNYVDRITINGIWYSEENAIKEGVVRAFQSFLSDLGDWCPTLTWLWYEILEAQDALKLEKSFSEEEVFDVLLGFSGDKALGPDRFSIAFWQFSWDFVKDEVMSFSDFHEHANFVKSLNAT